MNKLFTALGFITLISLISTQACKPKATDPCAVYEIALNGTYEARLMEGTMTFEGGMRGFMTAEGPDYNDMDCGYVILDCVEGTASMNCAGAPHETTLQAIASDTVIVSGVVYIRVK